MWQQTDSETSRPCTWKFPAASDAVKRFENEPSVQIACKSMRATLPSKVGTFGFRDKRVQRMPRGRKDSRGGKTLLYGIPSLHKKCVLDRSSAGTYPPKQCAQPRAHRAAVFFILVDSDNGRHPRHDRRRSQHGQTTNRAPDDQEQTTTTPSHVSAPAQMSLPVLGFVPYLVPASRNRDPIGSGPLGPQVLGFVPSAVCRVHCTRSHPTQDDRGQTLEYTMEFVMSRQCEGCKGAHSIRRPCSAS